MPLLFTRPCVQNLTNKLSMLYGSGGSYVGDVPAITLSNGYVIQAQRFHDGPQGVANGNQDVTCWPSALTAVQTWDVDLMAAYGAAMGLEQYKKGSSVMLGPGVNLARLPWNGRNFEYQGEDPWLASKMVSAEVWGIQSQNVSGCVKHYVFNVSASCSTHPGIMRAASWQRALVFSHAVCFRTVSLSPTLARACVRLSSVLRRYLPP